MALAVQRERARSAWAARTCAAAATRAAASPSSGFEGERGRRRAPPRRSGRGAARRRRARAWARARARPGCAGRYAAPYLRDALLDRGAHRRDARDRDLAGATSSALHAAVADALRESLEARGTPPLVMCHVSHLYRSGASLYFTFLARQEAGRRARAVARGQVGRERGDRGRAAARSPTTTPSAATTRPGCSAEVGELGLELLRAAKERLDPRRDHEPRQAAA